MKERPILFSGEMVRALLDGKKTQTRRVIVVDRVFSVLRPFYDGRFDDRGNFHYRVRQNMDGMIGLRDPHIAEQWCPHGQPGDRLWVRESWAARLDQDHLSPIQLPHGMTVGYWADGPSKCCNTGCAGTAGRVRASMHMPRWASRILLEITSVRVERVQDIGEDDAEAEGVEFNGRPDWAGYRQGFRQLWDSINAARGFGWDVNPWVWCVSFKKL